MNGDRRANKAGTAATPIVSGPLGNHGSGGYKHSPDQLSKCTEVLKRFHPPRLIDSGTVRLTLDDLKCLLAETYCRRGRGADPACVADNAERDLRATLLRDNYTEYYTLVLSLVGSPPKAYAMMGGRIEGGVYRGTHIYVFDMVGVKRRDAVSSGGFEIPLTELCKILENKEGIC